MKSLSKEQKVQESSYKYPYHYIPSWDGENFSQIKSLSWGYEYLSYLNYVLNYVKKFDFNKLLDVGCGDGRFLYELRKIFPKKELAGIDYSEQAIAFAQAFDSSVLWVNGDIKDESLFHMKFEIITLLETLEHIKPDEIGDFIDGIYSNLKETGELIVTVPSNNISVTEKHFQHFDLTSLENLLGHCFDIEKVSYLNKKSSAILFSLKKILHNRIYVMSSRVFLRLFYKYYLNNFLIAENNNCRRLFIVCKKK